MLYQHIPNKYYFASEVKEYNFKVLEGLLFFYSQYSQVWESLDHERHIFVDVS
jgi:hypothetical protein